MTLSIVVPALDEAKVIAEAVARVAAAAPDGEILIVDDGSTDATAEIATRALQGGKGRVLRLPENRGKGAAVKEGMLAATGEIRAFIDADLSVDPRYLGDLLAAHRRGAEVVVASRRLPGSRLDRHQPWIREAMGTVYRTTASLLLARGISDFTCGLKGFTAEAARDLFGSSRMPRFGFDVEVLYLARRRGYRIEEIPVAWSDEPDTRVRLPIDTARSLIELLAVPWNGLRGRYGPPRLPRGSTPRAAP
ncbi:MAG: glycosyltransferase [Acidobacteriota bacterium]